MPHGLQADASEVPPEGCSELTMLDHVSEESVCEVLKARLLAGEAYTSVASMLLAVNPCERWPEVYSEETLARHLGSEAEMPPHVFRTGASAYRGMLTGRNQSVVISGESGAGKTETFKRVMQFLSAAVAMQGGPRSGSGGGVGSASSGDRSVEQLLVETVPILESYGNASTIHNPDSSRFGKFVVLHFREHGGLAGVAVRTYLLETTRAVRLGSDERSFHVFYELLAGGRAQAARATVVRMASAAPAQQSPMTPRTVQRAFLQRTMSDISDDWSPEGPAGSSQATLASATPARAQAREARAPGWETSDIGDGEGSGGAASPWTGEGGSHGRLDYLLGFDVLTELRLEPLPRTRFLPPSTVSLPVPRDDAAKFADLIQALDAADVPPPEARELWQATAGCLHLGAIEFSRFGDSDDTPTQVTTESTPALRTAAELLGCEPAALLRAITLKQIRAGAEWIETPNSPAVCLELCDGLAKATCAAPEPTFLHAAA